MICFLSSDDFSENAKEIFGKNDVDGGLIGGAALNADNFIAIVNSF